MNPDPMVITEPRARTRGRLQLVVLVLVAVVPMVLATSMYRFGFWVPESRTYHGHLIATGQSRADLGVSADERRWQLLVSAPGRCAADCQQLVYLARQVQIGLGRDAARATHALATSQSLSVDYAEKLEREYAEIKRYPLELARYWQTAPGLDEPQLWIVDPHGNLVLRYGAQVKGKDLLDDLRRLLKLSNIG